MCSDPRKACRMLCQGPPSSVVDRKSIADAVCSPLISKRLWKQTPVLGLPQLNIDRRLRWLILSSNLPESLSRRRVYTQCVTALQSMS